MSERIDSDGDGRKSGRGTRVASCCIGVPVLIVVAVAGMWQLNNRVPEPIKIPMQTPPNPNGYDDFVRAGELARKAVHKSPYDNPKANWNFSAFAAAAKDAQPAIAALRQGLGKPYLCPPARSYASDNFRDFAKFRELTRALVGAADYYEIVGQPGRAVEIRLDAMEMSVMAPKGGRLINDLVSIACQDMAAKGFEELLPRLSSNELTRVAVRLDRIAAKSVPYADILLEEGNFQVAADMEMLKDPKGYRTIQGARDIAGEEDLFGGGDDSLSPKPPLMDRAKTTWKEADFLLADKGKMLRDNLAYMQAIAEEARKPYAGDFKTPVPHNLLAEGRGGLFYSKIWKRHLDGEAVIASFRVDTAMYRYKAAKGKFPEYLRDLTPTYLSVAPPTQGGAAKLNPPSGPARRRPLPSAPKSQK